MHFIPMSLKSFMFVILPLSFVCWLPLSLHAQGNEIQPPEKELVAPNLEPFVGAFKEISHIRISYKERIIKSEDPSQTSALQQEATQKMNQAVMDHGLTVEGYNTIYQTIQNDPTLKEAFMIVLNRTH